MVPCIAKACEWTATAAADSQIQSLQAAAVVTVQLQSRVDRQLPCWVALLGCIAHCWLKLSRNVSVGVVQESS